MNTKIQTHKIQTQEQKNANRKKKKRESKIKILTRRIKNTTQGISIMKFVYKLFHKKQLYIPPKVVTLIQHFS